jgi:hypothetical protein
MSTTKRPKKQRMRLWSPTAPIRTPKCQPIGIPQGALKPVPRGDKSHDHKRTQAAQEKSHKAMMNK